MQTKYISSCPFGYCCSGIQCRHYSSCATGREGVLCRRCKMGLTENILTPDCSCHHPWFLILVLLAGVIYVLLFMYLKELAKLLSVLLIPKCIFTKLSIFAKRGILCTLKDTYNKLTNKTSLAEPLTNDICCESAECDDVHLELLDTTKLPESSEITQLDDNFIPGLLKIIIFFYQACGLFKVYSAGRSKGSLHVIQEITTTLFSLRTDGLFFQDMSWCPFDNLQPVEKLLFKVSFILYLFIIIGVIFLISKILKLSQNNLRTIYTRLYCSTVRITLMSYATITVTCFTLLSCVNLGSKGKVLYIDGSIQCYTWWQFIVIVIICVWIASYPVAIYGVSWLFYRNRLSTRRLLLSLLLPFITVIYWIRIRIRCHKEDTAGAHLREENRTNENAEVVINALEGPFRKYQGTDGAKVCRLSWESILIGRRFVLIFIKTFVIDLLTRLYLLLFVTILFFMHHIYVRPFDSSFLNSLETVSLIILITICSLNILPASIYMNRVATSSYLQGFSKIFGQVETFLMLVFPIVIGCFAVIFGVVRILQLMILILINCVKLIRFCCKRKIL